METLIAKNWLENAWLEIVDQKHAAELLAAERSLVSSKASIKRLGEFRAGRYAARLALQNFGIVDQAILQDQKRSPKWPEGFVGSISHSKLYAAAIVAPKAHYLSLGLDIEDISSPRSTPLEKLAEKILTPAERSQLEDNLSYERLLTYFSAKEALFKAVYPLVHKLFWYHDAEMKQIADELWQAELLIDLNQNFPAGSLLSLQISYFENYCISVCYLK